MTPDAVARFLRRMANRLGTSDVHELEFSAETIDDLRALAYASHHSQQRVREVRRRMSRKRRRRADQLLAAIILSPVRSITDYLEWKAHRTP